MDGDIGEILQSVLSDPEQMGKLASMAQSIMGGAEPASSPAESAVQGTVPHDAKLLSVLTGLMGGRGKETRSAALLNAMRPYMRPEKQEKLDRAMQVSRMVHVAGTVMKELGGGGNGL